LYSLLVKSGTPATVEELLNPANLLCENACELRMFPIEFK
jgi:hypothetical protein